ncbi:MAG TPA: hypothetical protein VEA69_03830 [Tepidisphaeraceae bacterium]|nr:hypothetical protein [Tepidisphaeraceae bacterium]
MTRVRPFVGVDHLKLIGVAAKPTMTAGSQMTTPSPIECWERLGRHYVRWVAQHVKQNP